MSATFSCSRSIARGFAFLRCNRPAKWMVARKHANGATTLHARCGIHARLRNGETREPIEGK